MTKAPARIARPEHCRGLLPVLLLFLIGCIRSIPHDQPLGLLKGVVTNPAGKPAEDAQVYVYKWSFDEESIEGIIRDEIGDGATESKDYGDYRGPADFKSAKTGVAGKYQVVVPPGTYCLVARRRYDRKINQGPLNPQDFSSLVSEPIKVEPEKTIRLSLKLIDTLRDADFFDRYLIRTYRTGFSGRVLSSVGRPVSGVFVTANEGKTKISQRSDFISFPTDSEGSYTLYVYYEGVYHLGIKRRILGPYLAFHKRGNSADKTTSALQGQIISNVDLVLEDATSDFQ